MVASTRSPIDIGLTLVPDGVPDDFVPIFQMVFNAIRALQQNLGDYSGANFTDPQYLIDNALANGQSFQTQNLQILRIPALVAVAKGQLVNILDDGSGHAYGRLAIASNMITKAMGIALNSSAVVNDPLLVAMFSGYFNGYSGFATAVTYYLSSTTPGAFTSVAPVAAGTIKQELGMALSASEFLLNIKTAIQN